MKQAMAFWVLIAEKALFSVLMVMKNNGGYYEFIIGNRITNRSFKSRSHEKSPSKIRQVN